MKKFSCLLFLILGLFGCATISSINKNYKRINYSDGINKKEAAIIAQKDCLEYKYCKDNYVLSSPKVRKDKNHPGHWLVRFPPEHIVYRLKNKHWTHIYVDKNTGKIDSRTVTE